VRRQGLEPLLEYALALEAEQDLDAKDQCTRLVQRRLYLLVQGHRRLSPIHRKMRERNAGRARSLPLDDTTSTVDVAADPG
jgi:hypothetical protein